MNAVSVLTVPMAYVLNKNQYHCSNHKEIPVFVIAT